MMVGTLPCPSGGSDGNRTHLTFSASSRLTAEMARSPRDVSTRLMERPREGIERMSTYLLCVYFGCVLCALYFALCALACALVCACALLLCCFVLCALCFVLCLVPCALCLVVCGLWFVVCGLWFVVCGFEVECVTVHRPPL